MQKITLKIEGMMCGNCEKHVNESVEKSFSVKKVTSSHDDGTTVIIAENDIPRDKLESVIDSAGYKLVSVESEPYKKGLFSR